MHQRKNLLISSPLDTNSKGIMRYSFVLILAALIIGLCAQENVTQENVTQENVVKKSGQCPKREPLNLPEGQKKHCKTRGHCSSDGDCPGDYLCCGCPRECVPPRVKKIRKPRLGKCPIKVEKPLPSHCAASSIINECDGERPCSEREKCCPASECGGNMCVPTDRLLKPQRPLKRCPKIPKRKPEICATARPSFSCDINEPCVEAGKMCCPGVCGGSACIGRGDDAPLG